LFQEKGVLGRYPINLSAISFNKAVMLFKRFLADKIVAGQKTQTRRPIQPKRGYKVREVGDRVGVQVGFRPPLVYVIIKRKSKQALGEISEEDAKKEGFASVEEFKKAWLRLYGKWDPKHVVCVGLKFNPPFPSLMF